MEEPESKPVLLHKYSMDATLKRSIPVVEAEVEVGFECGRCADLLLRRGACSRFRIGRYAPRESFDASPPFGWF